MICRLICQFSGFVVSMHYSFPLYFVAELSEQWKPLHRVSKYKGKENSASREQWFENIIYKNNQYGKLKEQKVILFSCDISLSTSANQQ